MAVIAIIIVAALTALVCLLTRTYRACFIVAAIGNGLVLLLCLAVAAGFAALGLPVIADLHTGGLARLLIALIGLVQFGAVAASGPYLAREIEEKIVTVAQARWYYAMVPLFVLSMVLAIAAESLGLMWIAIEGTTLATTMLVAFYTKDGSLEAAWKYILVCSVGIAIGLVGVLLLYYAAVSSGANAEALAVTWSGLMALAAHLPPAVVKLAFVFFFIGFGAKVGIVPMHTWLPDAHGRTPSPISGLLSGVLLPVALFAIIRAKTLTDAVLGSTTWTDSFFIIFGALTVAVAAAFMIQQKNYKRLLAYSSIEHMGLAVFALALGAPGLVIAAVHLTGHALAKSSLFFGTGNILNAYGSTKFKNVSGVARYLPMTGALFTFGLLFLLAVPPSPLFFSEVTIIAAAIVPHPIATAFLLFAIVVAGASFFAGFMPMLFDPRDEAAPVHKTAERWGTIHTVMLVGLVALCVIGGAFIAGYGWSFFAQLISLQ